ncbi:MAG TPA: DUF5681 domain-containing protein [Bacteroidales bacterium]|nr:DUF5681 domain-containing protein [Bacteroidales bacterium]
MGEKGFKKGQSGNPNGRKPGKPNMITYDMREALRTILEAEIKTLPELLKQMNPEKRADVLAKLLQYVAPKMQNVEMQTEFDKMTDEQLDMIIERLKNNQA